MIIDLDGDVEAAPGRDRRRAVTLAFALCLAVGSAGLGRDAPAATQAWSTERATTMFFDRGGVYVSAAPADRHLSLPPNTTDVLLSFIPDRLANEALPPLTFVPVRVRAASGLAVEARRPGDYQMVTWTEGGNAYWLVSNRRDIADLVRLADSLR
ncbi:MAG: hypothetical protein M3O99_00625 [Chloroflexota bacterium]|nr:hypothetical protein [Chloroflexota bacterium]